MENAGAHAHSNRLYGRSNASLSSAIIKPLVYRLTKEIKRGNVFYACSCKAWLDKHFISEWIYHVTNDLEQELESIFCTRATVCDNVLTCLTELNMVNAVTEILTSKEIRDRLKEYSEWYDVLQRGLEISCIQKENVSLIRAFSSAQAEDSVHKLQGTKLLLHALQHSNGECAVMLLQNTEIDPRQGVDIRSEFFKYSETALAQQITTDAKDKHIKRIADFLSDLGVEIMPLQLGTDSNSISQRIIQPVVDFKDRFRQYIRSCSQMACSIDPPTSPTREGIVLVLSIPGVNMLIINFLGDSQCRP